MSRMYIAVLDEFPDYMVPTLVAHTVLGAHLKFSAQKHDSYWGGSEPVYPQYNTWLTNSFKKCVVKVNQKEFDKIAALPNVYLGYENNTLEGRKSCAIVCPYAEGEKLPNVLKFAKLWKPSCVSAQWAAFDKVLAWINTQEEKMIAKGELYDAVMEMRPEQ
jgi:hypothetical protein